MGVDADFGERYLNEQALPGDIAAVAKVDEIHFDAVLHDAPEDEHIHLKPLAFQCRCTGWRSSPSATVTNSAWQRSFPGWSMKTRA